MAGGYKLWSTGEVVTAANLQNYVQNQTVMVFASASARTTALSGVLAEGMISYRTDSHVLEIYNGSAWIGVGSVLTTKGDISVYSTASDRLPIGTTNQTLIVDSTQSTGMKWAPSPQSTLSAKGSLVSASAANTLAELTVGVDGQTLAANSSAANGLSWQYTYNAFNAQTGTSYTFVAADAAKKLVTVSNASAITVTIPPSVFSAGQTIDIQSIGAGIATFAQGAGVTITSTGGTASAPKLRAQYSAATVICTTTNTFTIVGDLS
jgi:hypothetical protein